MKVLKDIALLYVRSFRETKANAIWVAIGISSPLLFLLLFTPLLQNLAGGPGFRTDNVLNVFLPGILAFMAFGSGNGPGFSTVMELQQGTTERLRVTPVSRFALLASPILNSATWFLIFSAVLVAAAIPFGFELHVGGLVLSLLLMALTLILFSAFSISVALATKDVNSLAAVTNGINLPVLLLSGVLLPLALAPGWMRAIAHVNPLFYVVEASRVLASGAVDDTAVGLAFLVMIPLAIGALWGATRAYRKAVA
jgi:ABC-2 type transport system permease protein